MKIPLSPSVICHIVLFPSSGGASEGRVDVRGMETSARDGFSIILLVGEAVALRSGTQKTNLTYSMCGES